MIQLILGFLKRRIWEMKKEEKRGRGQARQAPLLRRKKVRENLELEGGHQEQGSGRRGKKENI